MTKKLSQAFFGDKKFTEKVYTELISNGQINRNDIGLIFEPYTSKLQSSEHNSNGVSRYDIFVEFIQAAIQEYRHWSFQKLSSVVEIAAHVFQYSFERWLSREQSFKHFSDVLVRHSLFRPPHSVCIFNYEQLNQLTTWWLAHFDRYYQEYSECMGSDLNQVLICSALPADSSSEHPLSQGKAMDKAEFTKLLQ